MKALLIGVTISAAACSSTTSATTEAGGAATATAPSTVPPPTLPSGKTVPPTLPPGVTAPPPTTKPSGPPCVASQLAWDFRSLGRGAGNDFGGIVARNTGAMACQLTGSVQVTALDAHLRPIELFQALQPGTVPAGVVLSADAPRWLGSHQFLPGAFYADIDLNATARDNPKTGQLCSPADEVMPADWQVSMLGTSWTVANHDPGNGPGDQPQEPSLYACLGDFNMAGIGQVPN